VPCNDAFQNWLDSIPNVDTVVTCDAQITNRLTIDKLDIFYWFIPTLLSPAGIVELKTTFRNTSSSLISDLSFQVTVLSNGNLLLNADNGPGTVGARLSVPAWRLGEDGALLPGETVRVSFQIGLQQFRAFDFRGVAYGTRYEAAGGVTSVATEDTPFHVEVTTADLESARQQGGLYLPHVSR
jgi:hypothetical protein